MPQIILASTSPRRQELLRLLYDRFAVCPSDADETLPEGISPADAVEFLAEKKARAVWAERCDDGCVVIGADTVVAVDGMILGKPRDHADAAAMLRQLSGKIHQVYTGVALCGKTDQRVFHCCTEVEFCEMREDEIAWYVQTEEPTDKAGAYGIQGYGARFIKGIRGDYYNVMGLPIHMIYTNIGEIAK